MEMKILSYDSALVRKLTILRKFNLLVFSSAFDLSELQIRVPSSMGCGNKMWCLGWREFLVRVVGTIMVILQLNYCEIFGKDSC